MTTLLDDVTNLPVGEELVVVGGWISVSGGHAVVYVVERLSESKHGFVVCNTGDGATWHPAAGLILFILSLSLSFFLSLSLYLTKIIK